MTAPRFSTIHTLHLGITGRGLDPYDPAAGLGRSGARDRRVAGCEIELDRAARE